MVKSISAKLFRNHNSANQDGVTLLLTVMIVSAILVISMTVAFFVVQEIRAVRSSVLTEPAIIAAETAGEQGIYRIKRDTFTSDCGAASYTQLDGSTGGSSNVRIKKCVSFKPAVLELDPLQPPLELYLYDPADVNGNVCLEEGVCDEATGKGAGDQLYSAIKVKHLNGGSLRITVVTLDGVLLYNTLITPGSSPSFGIDANILNSTDERLKISLRPTTVDATIEISTEGLYTGLPDYRTIDAQGCVGQGNVTDCEANPETYNRRINITVPAPQ